MHYRSSLERKNMFKIDVPLVIIAFNRPDLLNILAERLKTLKFQTVYVIVDGPRQEHLTDHVKVEEVIEIIGKIEFAENLKVIKSETNLGCKNRIISGLNEVFSLEEKAIILEDDCIPSTSFFPYCEFLLQKYEFDNKVGIISGTNLSGVESDPNRYHYSKYANIWGWATWRRVWQNYDEQMTILEDRDFQLNFAGWCQFPLEYRYWNNVFRQTQSGHIDTWDYQLWLSVWKQGQLSVIPGRNLIDNVGFAHQDATHTFLGHPAQSLVAEELEFPLVSPKSKLASLSHDRAIHHTLYKYPNFINRVIGKLRRILPK